MADKRESEQERHQHLRKEVRMGATELTGKKVQARGLQGQGERG